jgi:hypothetical protein
MTRRRASIAAPTAPTALLGDIRTLIDAARKRAASAVNSELSMLYWRIGQRIHTQVLEGRRADYGEEVVLTRRSARASRSRRCSASAGPSLRCACFIAATTPGRRVIRSDVLMRVS